MTSLKCSATTCMHNSDHYCCKNVISVDGSTATAKDNTFCGSFDESRGGSFKNSYETPNHNLKIECEATNCVYNDNKLCNADHIDISGSGAKHADDTECATFRMR